MVLFVISSAASISQNLVVDGYSMVIQDSSSIYVPGELIAENTVANPSIFLDGSIYLKGDIVNQSYAAIFSGIEAQPQGTLNMCGDFLQSIRGDSAIYFENLVVSNYRKMMNSDACRVYGTLTIDAMLDLNSNKLIIENPSDQAISYKSQYIKSESQPWEQLGEIEWKIGDSTGIYQVPFGSGLDTLNDLNLTLSIQSPGTPNTAAVKFATYPSDYQNMPMPDGVSTLSPYQYNFLGDRYWKIASDHFVKPDVSILFSYNSTDIDPSLNYGIFPDSLKAYRYNEDLHDWGDWIPDCNSFPSLKKVSAENISGENFFSDWMIGNTERQILFFTPNAFTPDGDGLNDFFIPVFNFNPESFRFYILDRFWHQIYMTEDVSKPWNGTNFKDHPMPIGVYVWILEVTDEYGKSYYRNGSVTLLR